MDNKKWEHYLNPGREGLFGIYEKDEGARSQFSDLISLLPKGIKCLDIGCASGWTTEEISKKYDFVWGTSISEEEIDFAVEHHITYMKTQFIVSDMHELHFLADVFDAVVMSNCIGQALSPFIALAEANRVSKEGAYLLTNTAGPDWDNWKWHYINPTPQQLKHLLERSGFNVIEERTLNNGHFHCLSKKIGEVKL